MLVRRHLSWLLLLMLCQLHAVTLRAQARRTDTFSVFFPFDESKLNETARFTIDSLQYREALNNSSKIRIIGYADYVGSNEYNDVLSLRRAKAVEHYLLLSGFRKSNVELILAKGEVPRPGMDGREGYEPDRRVDLVLLRDPVPRYEESYIAKVRPDRNRDRKKAPVKAAPKPSVAAPPPAPAPKLFDEKQYIPAAKTSTKTEDLNTLPVNSAVILRNIYFPSGQHFMYEYSLPELEKLYRALQQQPTLCIRIEGHVCCIDSKRFADALDEGTGEYRLSLNRAKYVYDYLVRKGIDPRRLQYHGFGKRKPIIEKEQDFNDAEVNRRVEIRILSR